jgi:hypothetical protein
MANAATIISTLKEFSEMSKQLLVSSAVQAALMNSFLLAEIQSGFWKDQRPVTHGPAWEGVEVLVSTSNIVGPVGEWKPLRFYDFLNPEFTKIHEAKLVEIARTIKPNVTFKALKKELIELARIIGGRMTDKTQEPARVYRGNNRTDFDVIRTVERKKVMTVAGAKANVAAAAKTVTKKTVIKATQRLLDAITAAKKTAKKVDQPEEGVTIIKTAAGATVRRVAVKTTPVQV